jgi:hypothetical protein
MRTWVAGLVCLALAPLAGAQPIPRASDGRPDFSGNWISPWTTTLERGPASTTLVISAEEGAKLKDAFISGLHQTDPLGASFIWDLTGPVQVRGETRSSLIVDPPDGKLPYTAEGRARRAAFRPMAGEEDPEQRSLTERCLMAGSGYAPFMSIPASNLRQVVQTRDHVLFFTESFGQLRIVPLDGRSGPVIPRGGASKGRWEGDTLVIETAGIGETDRFRVAPLSTFGISPATRITERFSYAGPDEIHYAFTVEDPLIYTRPWAAELTLKRSSGRVFEWACHEGNYSLANILRGARVAEGRVAKAAKPAAGRR